MGESVRAADRAGHGGVELLPKKAQEDLTKSGIRYHPEFGEYLLKVGEHMWDGRTDAGLARIKRRGLAALASEEAKKAAAGPAR